MTRYALDSNLYIRAARSAEEAERPNRFLHENIPRMYLHSVVLQEVMLGGKDRVQAQEIRQAVGARLVRVGRVVTPSHRTWSRAAELTTLMVERGLISRGGYTPSFFNDVLIAASCREVGVTLVTANTAGFERIAHVEPFDFAHPWPTGATAS